MGLSVRIFGLSSWSILLPEALLGVASVVLLFVIVRRDVRAGRGDHRGLVMALTPAAVLMFRYNNPDALLTFLLVAGAWALDPFARGGPRPLGRPRRVFVGSGSTRSSCRRISSCRHSS